MTQKNGVFVGIDLGTTFSAISFYNQNTKDVELINFGIKDNSIPSWVSFSQIKEGGIVVGNDAKNDINTEHVCYDAKRIIGKKLDDINFDDRQSWPFLLSSVDENDISTVALISMDIPTKEEREKFYPEEISAIILRHLKNNLDKQLNYPEYEKVVVTVPAMFNDIEKKATLDAAKIAGFKNIFIMNEPTAAVLEYQRLHKDSLKENSKILVVDFGGGTLDISCCKYTKGEIIVSKNGGDQHFGGNEFDNVMVELIKDKLEEYDYADRDSFNPLDEDEDDGSVEFRDKQDEIKKKIMRLKKIAEQVKIALTDKEEVEINVHDITKDDENEDDSFEITRKDFEKKCKDEGLYKKFFDCLKKITNSAQFRMNNTDLILLIGGTCKIPSVRNEIFKLFDKSKVADETFNGMTAVCKGACHRAHSFSTGLSTVHDTIPQSIGLEVNGNQFDKMISEGTRLPASSKKQYYTIMDNQTEARFAVFMGPSMTTDSLDMTFVDRMIISNIPAKNRGEIKFNVEMHIGDDGLLTLNAGIVGQTTTEGNGLKVSMEMEKPDDHVEKLEQHIGENSFWP